jgi:hypothetical protein
MLSLFAAGLRQRPGIGSDHMASSTVKVHLAFLRSMLRWAVMQTLIESCPRFPEVKVPKKKPLPVPGETFECLYGKADDDAMRAFLLCGWLAGLRLNEAFELEREQTDLAPWVDFGRRRIWLPAAFSKAVADQWIPLDAALAVALALFAHRSSMCLPLAIYRPRW